MARGSRGLIGSRTYRWRWALLIPVLITLASCRTPSFLCVKPSGLRRVNIVAGPLANDARLALDGDIVFVTNKAALKTIEGLSAAEYFRQRDQLKSDYPDGLRLNPFGLKAGQHGPLALDPPCNLAGALLFVNYDNDKPNRMRLTKAKSGTLTLGDNAFTWQRR